MLELHVHMCVHELRFFPRIKLHSKIRGNLFASPGDNLLDAIAAFSQAGNKVGMGSRDFLAADQWVMLRLGERRLPQREGQGLEYGIAPLQVCLFLSPR